MEFRNIRALLGPNIWTRCTALEVAVDLEMKFPMREIPGSSRVCGWLPAVYHPGRSPADGRCGVGATRWPTC